MFIALMTVTGKVDFIIIIVNAIHFNTEDLDNDMALLRGKCEKS